MKRVVTQRRRVIAVFALLLPLAHAYAQNPPTSPPEPAEAKGSPKAAPTVVEVRLVSEDGKTLQTTLPEIAARRGAPLDPRQVADSLRTLYRTGDYADLKAVTVDVEGGVRLDFVARENLFFGEVRIEGLTPPPSEASAAAAMQLALGQTYRQVLLDEALGRLKEALRDDGLYLAELSERRYPTRKHGRW